MWPYLTISPQIKTVEIQRNLNSYGHGNFEPRRFTNNLLSYILMNRGEKMQILNRVKTQTHDVEYRDGKTYYRCCVCGRSLFRKIKSHGHVYCNKH